MRRSRRLGSGRRLRWTLVLSLPILMALPTVVGLSVWQGGGRAHEFGLFLMVLPWLAIGVAWWEGSMPKWWKVRARRKRRAMVTMFPDSRLCLSIGYPRTPGGERCAECGRLYLVREAPGKAASEA